MTKQTKSASPKVTPDFYVHAVVPKGETTRVGSRLGAVFNHKKGGGFTILLDAAPIPVNGQIELIAYLPKQS